MDCCGTIVFLFVVRVVDVSFSFSPVDEMTDQLNFSLRYKCLKIKFIFLYPKKRFMVTSYHGMRKELNDYFNPV